MILTGAWRGRNRLLVVAAAAGGWLLAPDPDGRSRLYGNAPGDPVSRPAQDIPVSGGGAAEALPEVDQKRIMLVGKTGSVPLTEAYLASVDVTEWFGKIRVFLRKHGWVPESEREPAA